MRGDILGSERRRRWSDEDKLSIVTAVGVDGASVTQVAQCHDITRQQIYTWRHELKKKGLLSAPSDTLFLPVELELQEALPAAPEPNVDRQLSCPLVELQLANGRCLRFDPLIEPASLMRVIQTVEAA
jgi:transposase